MKTITFKDLWKNYPSDPPCNKEKFKNQCAIKVGHALAKCGVDTTKLVKKGRHCWFHDKKHGHVLAAEELANALNKSKILGIKPSINIPSECYKSMITGKKGIIFFKDYWLRNSDSPESPTGDHIDLWNGSRLTDWRTYFRIQWSIVIPNVWSDLEAATRVTFWQVD